MTTIAEMIAKFKERVHNNPKSQELIARLKAQRDQANNTK